MVIDGEDLLVLLGGSAIEVRPPRDERSDERREGILRMGFTGC